MKPGASQGRSVWLPLARRLFPLHRRVPPTRLSVTEVIWPMSGEGWLFLGLGVGVIGVSVFQYFRRRCEECGQSWSLRPTEEKLRFEGYVEWKCRYCGHTEWKRDSGDQGGASGNIWGPGDD